MADYHLELSTPRIQQRDRTYHRDSSKSSIEEPEPSNQPLTATTPPESAPFRPIFLSDTRICNELLSVYRFTARGWAVLSLAKAAKDYYLRKLGEISPGEDYYLRGGTATGTSGAAAAPPSWVWKGRCRLRGWCACSTVNTPPPVNGWVGVCVGMGWRRGM